MHDDRTESREAPTCDRHDGVAARAGTGVRGCGCGTGAVHLPVGRRRQDRLRVGNPSDMVSPTPSRRAAPPSTRCSSCFDLLFGFSVRRPVARPRARHQTVRVEHRPYDVDLHIRADVKWSDGVRSPPRTSRSPTGSSSTTGSPRSPITCLQPHVRDAQRHHVIWRAEEPTFAPDGPAVDHDPPRARLGQARRPAAQGDRRASGRRPDGRLRPVRLLTEWKPGKFFTMEANKDYWGGSPTIDEIVYQRLRQPRGHGAGPEGG